MVSKTYGAAVIGVDAHAVTIEVNVGRGLYFYMSGLPDSAVKQSEHRVSAALQVSGYRMPRTKVIVNLAPADMRKEGSAYDLAIALAILRASGQLVKVPLQKYMIMGELSLDGTLTPIRGVLLHPAGVALRMVNSRSSRNKIFYSGLLFYGKDTFHII